MFLFTLIESDAVNFFQRLETPSSAFFPGVISKADRREEKETGFSPKFADFSESRLVDFLSKFKSDWREEKEPGFSPKFADFSDSRLVDLLSKSERIGNRSELRRYFLSKE